MRRGGAPVSLVTLVSVLASFVRAPVAFAATETEDEVAVAAPERERAATAGGGSKRSHAVEALHQRVVEAEAAPGSVGLATEHSPAQIMSLPTGGDKTGVSSQTISVPQGAGKVQGMGESFSAQLSTGAGSFSVPIGLPAARGGASPSLALAYGSSSGHGIAGIGWDVGVPFIARQTNRGLPTYDDSQSWHPNQDRFVFNGGQELVPICLVTGATCPGAQPGEVMPVWASAWQYFRPRVEGSFLRFFWSPDHRTWRVQSKSGESMELGAPLDGSDAGGALEVDPRASSHIFRWNLARQYDAVGEANPPSGPVYPTNVTVYRYLVDDGMSYLSDIYDTPPRDNSRAPLTAYAHHTRLRYESRSDATFSYRRGWRVGQALRLAGVDVASKPFAGGSSAPRELVRRTWLAYDPAYHVSLLTRVEVEGRCGATLTENASEAFGATSCPRLPPMTFGYQHVAPRRVDGSPGSADLLGYEGFDERVIAMASSPLHSLDEELTDLFDVNADALPDVLVTAPSPGDNYQGKHGVFFNGGGGRADAFTPDLVGVRGANGEDASTITLRNLNLSPGDLDGDGTIDLVHMPQVKTYSVYTPQRLGTQWWWIGRPITTAAAQSPKINLGRDGLDTQRMDVNGDGLVDMVLSAGTEMETFFALGKFPGGDGQFGHARWTGANAATLSNDPVASCVPWSGLPIRLSDSDIKIGDMNGDGLADIVRIHQGEIFYWPGRGNGFWGTGSKDDCAGGGFGSNRHIAMATSPRYSDPNGSELRLDDVNGDGLDDLVQVRFQDVDVWLNVDGTSWTPRHVINGTPAAPSFQNRVRVADINGSGTRDILWGDGLNYRYIDLAGGARPWVLTRVENGLGKSTDLEYSTSTALMLAAEKAGQPWTSKAPMPIHVVTKVTESDNLNLIGRPAGKYVTTYSYRDPVYDGRQREFRGFRTARATRVGDANSPTSSTESTFLLGECKDEEPPAGGVPSPCTFEGRWRDNPREALKGLPVTSDTFDEKGTYLSTAHHTYRLRDLYKGLDGRVVRHAFEVATDNFLYDTSSNDHAVTHVPLRDVEVERDPPEAIPTTASAAFRVLPPDTESSVDLHGSAGRVHTQSLAVVDVFGNATQSIAMGQPGIDETITSYAIPNRPGGEPTGWLYRTYETYVMGAAHPYDARHYSQTAFNALGKPVQTITSIRGTLPLDRFHAANRAVAPAPSGASQDGVVFQSGSSYDALGNTVFQVSAGQRCRAIDYDSAYAQLPVIETVYVGELGASNCGKTTLTSSAEYDRGLGAVTDVRDLHNERTRAAYDGFGRITKLWKSDPVIVGALSRVPSVEIEYLLPPERVRPEDPIMPYSRVHTRAQDGRSPNDASYREAWAYADGLGRVLVTLDQADPDAGDAGQWIAHGLTNYDAKGAAERAYLAWFYSGDPSQYPLGDAPTTPYGRQRYDAFGRQVQTFGLDGKVTLQSAYHALSVDKWDAADLVPGPHQGTYASARQDGHGRAVSVTERVHVGGRIEEHETQTTYLATGEPETIRRVRSGTNDAVVRWIRYDTAGRMVLNVEPNTTKGFNPNPATDPSTMKAWRYSYNDAGDLVGTSDARGCGTNYHYDAGGRILAEDYSPCAESHAPYSTPDVKTGVGAEVFYRYDTADPDAAGIAGFPIRPELLLGRAVSVSDRASQSVTQFDGRGRVTGIARRLAWPADGSIEPGLKYAPRWYVQTVAFDGADRPLSETTGAVDGSPAALDVRTVVTTDYTKRGLVKSVGSNYGALVNRTVHDADGLPQTIEYGDAAKTTTAFSYDNKRRLGSVTTYRGPPPLWSATSGGISPAPQHGGAPTTLQLLLEDSEFAYDAVDNPTEIHDWRIADEWPNGAKPVTRKMQYDDLYRVTRVDYQQTGGADSWVSPFAAENKDENPDPRRAKPSPHVRFDKRIQWQSFQYDWLGNTVATNDDARGFYDRSLGTITNGTAGAGPYQLKSATNASAAPGGGSRQGALTIAYDDAGNMTGLVVRRDGPCLPAVATCSQLFAYAWDEVGRLAQARRWDLTEPGSTEGAAAAVPAVDLRYAYDAADDRVIKTAADAGGNAVHTLYPADALELRRAIWSDSLGDYERTARTEAAYLFAHGVRLGRVVTGEEDLPSATSGTTHVFLELMDHLGSTAIVVDRETSELVEQSTYQGYGAAETDYRAERWKSFREDYRFTGKEEDVEVGLQYFGKRYLAPDLGRWVSADPLTIHGLGADLNAYAYVHGRVFVAVDPQGLEELVRELTKARLDAIAAAYGVGSTKPEGVNRERAIGRWFQNSLLRTIGLAENGRQFASAERAQASGGRRKYAVPDGVANLDVYKADGTASDFVRSIKYAGYLIANIGAIVRNDSAFYEFKALKEGREIHLGDSDSQIRGLIDAASNQDATRSKDDPAPSTIHFVTTRGVTIGDDVTKFATRKDVLLVQHIAEEIYDTSLGTSTVRIGAGLVLNPGVLASRGTNDYESDPSTRRSWLPGPGGNSGIVPVGEGNEQAHPQSVAAEPDVPENPEK
jgi:RHS repeat-associated protein